MRSSLARYQPIAPMDESELQDKRERAYHEQGIFIFTPEQMKRFDEWERLALDAMAIKIYGKRKKHD